MVVVVLEVERGQMVSTKIEVFGVELEWTYCHLCDASILVRKSILLNGFLICVECFVDKEL